jgi:hypothetical protein
VPERAAIAEIGGDSGRAKRVTSDRRVNARRNRAPADQALSHLASKGSLAVLNWFPNPLTLLKPTFAKR